jgi:hypothetical protein
MKVRVWPYASIELYLGKRSPDEMLAAAVKVSDRSLTQFHVGEWYALQGNSGKAVTAPSRYARRILSNTERQL